MKKQTITVRELLSKDTVEKLDAALSKGNMEQLKKHMERLFTYKNIYNMHDNHLIELAECIVDLGQSDDLMECAREMEHYAQRRISRYQEHKKRLTAENQWAKATNRKSKVAMLDLQYQLWVYEFGYEYSKFHMYMMLNGIIHNIYEKEGT